MSKSSGSSPFPDHLGQLDSLSKSASENKKAGCVPDPLPSKIGTRLGIRLKTQPCEWTHTRDLKGVRGLSELAIEVRSRGHVGDMDGVLGFSAGFDWARSWPTMFTISKKNNEGKRQMLACIS